MVLCNTMYYMRRTFIETPIFTEKIEELGGQQLLRLIEDEILDDPDCGATISGTGGLRKLRAADPSRQKGKHGGLRVIYLDLPDRERTYFLYVYGKDEAEDLSAGEKKAMKKLVEIIKGVGYEKK
ncbi:MAG: hypothetical protein HYV97_03895 [Bdellovibrio sp.]|nr:hypothetical protein [Bdellovibrio sp.]